MNHFSQARSWTFFLVKVLPPPPPPRRLNLTAPRIVIRTLWFSEVDGGRRGRRGTIFGPSGRWCGSETTLAAWFPSNSQQLLIIGWTVLLKFQRSTKSVFGLNIACLRFCRVVEEQEAPYTLWINDKVSSSCPRRLQLNKEYNNDPNLYLELESSLRKFPVTTSNTMIACKQRLFIIAGRNLSGYVDICKGLPKYKYSYKGHWEFGTSSSYFLLWINYRVCNSRDTCKESVKMCCHYVMYWLCGNNGEFKNQEQKRHYGKCVKIH